MPVRGTASRASPRGISGTGDSTASAAFRATRCGKRVWSAGRCRSRRAMRICASRIGRSGNSARTGRENTRVFTQQRPTPVSRTPFSQQQRGMEQGFRGGSPQPADRTQTPANGWRRFGDPGRQSQPAATSPRADNSGVGRNVSPGRAPEGNRESIRLDTPVRSQAPQNRSGWQRFGDPARRRANRVDPQTERRAPQAPEGRRTIRRDLRPRHAARRSRFGPWRR